MDKIFINGLTVQTLIGVYAWEREAKRNLVVDVEMGFDTRKAGASDALEDALNYAAVAAKITDIADNSHYQLLEALAETIAQKLLDNFKLPWLKLTLHKPGAVANAKSVGVVIERYAPSGKKAYCA